MRRGFFILSEAYMKKITFITGGARSGKSSYAEERAASHAGTKLYIATAEALDEEMRSRIELHKRRRGDKWQTIEEPIDIAPSIRDPKGASCVLLDCLTLWLTNVMLRNRDVKSESARLMDAIRACPAPVYIVSNEVGMGIVPADELSRAFRDEAGRLNQQIAAISDEAYIVVAGLPLKLK